MDDILLAVWLAGKYKAGHKLPKRLLGAFGTFEEIYDASKQDYVDKGFTVSEISPLLGKSLEYSKKVCEYCLNNRIKIMTCESGEYPSGLYDLEAPPVVLFCKGVLPNVVRVPYVTVVGTRNMSRDGARAAHKLAFDIISGGGAVVSGIARGIDAMAHLGALDGEGKTLAIMGSGIDVEYPRENALLFDRIANGGGALVTEYFPGVQPISDNFPVRNRLLAAISQATVVVEAPIGSGALITVDIAKQLNRRVYAVPGALTNPLAEGSNYLLKEGALPLLDVYDVLERYESTFFEAVDLNRMMHSQYKTPVNVAEFEPVTVKKPHPDDFGRYPEPIDRSDELAGDIKEVYIKLMKTGPASADALVCDKYSLGDVLFTLTQLEMCGYVTVNAGGIYSVK